MPNGVKNDSLDALVDEAVAIQYIFLEQGVGKHCIAYNLERTASGGYFDYEIEDSGSRAFKALETGIHNWTQEEVKVAQVHMDAFSRDLHNRLDAFCEG